MSEIGQVIEKTKKIPNMPIFLIYTYRHTQILIYVHMLVLLINRIGMA